MGDDGERCKVAPAAGDLNTRVATTDGSVARWGRSDCARAEATGWGRHSHAVILSGGFPLLFRHSALLPSLPGGTRDTHQHTQRSCVHQCCRAAVPNHLAAPHRRLQQRRGAARARARVVPYEFVFDSGGSMFISDNNLRPVDSHGHTRSSHWLWGMAQPASVG